MPKYVLVASRVCLNVCNITGSYKNTWEKVNFTTYFL